VKTLWAFAAATWAGMCLAAVLASCGAPGVEQKTVYTSTITDTTATETTTVAAPPPKGDNRPLPPPGAFQTDVNTFLVRPGYEASIQRLCHGTYQWYNGDHNETVPNAIDHIKSIGQDMFVVCQGEIHSYRQRPLAKEQR
jgi:hypothetical protein